MKTVTITLRRTIEQTCTIEVEAGPRALTTLSKLAYSATQDERYPRDLIDGYTHVGSWVNKHKVHALHVVKVEVE